MNSKKIVSAIVLSLVMGSAFASLNTPIGSGTIDGTVNRVVNVSLAPMISLPYIYDINCNVTDLTGGNFPAVVKLEVPGPAMGMPASLLFDGGPLSTNQAELSDNDEHRFTAPRITGNSLQSGSTLTLSWVGGDDVATPISYSCYFTPSFGRKK